MKHLAIFLSCLVIAGCGSNRGNQNNPLSPEQITKFAGTLESVGRVQKAGPAAQKSGQRAESGDSRDETLQKMATKLEAGNCEYVLPKTPDQTPSDPYHQSSEAGIKVSGATCPVALELNVKSESKFSIKSLSNKMEFVLKYDVKDAEFAALNDITAVDIKGSGGVDATQTSISGNLNIEGAMTSTKEGALKMYVVGKVDGTGDGVSSRKINSELIWGVEYPTYTAELKQVQKEENNVVTTEYFLNSKTVTEAEFKTFLEKAGSIGQVSIHNSKQ